MFTIREYVGLFFIYSFLGWCVEVAYAAVTTGRVVNRGFLNGPVCPIYGFGMGAVLTLLLPLKQNTLLLFCGGMVLASSVELIGGWMLMKLFHTRWWDYSEYPLNLGGYICLCFSLAWGAGTIIMVRLVHPLLYGIYCLQPVWLTWAIQGLVFALFAGDIAATVVTVLGFQKELRELEELADKMHDFSDALTWKLGNAALEADTRADEARLQLILAKAEGKKRKEELSLNAKMLSRKSHQELADGFEAMLARNTEVSRHVLRNRWFGPSRLMKAFPNMKPERVGHAPLLKKLREDMEAARSK